uniref:TF-B3 domain-containing protein n=1 Tax=Fagus sylvatica TaxID=28930 RepID=A0A2N9GQA8_FAGSY
MESSLSGTSYLSFSGMLGFSCKPKTQETHNSHHEVFTELTHSCESQTKTNKRKACQITLVASLATDDDEEDVSTALTPYDESWFCSKKMKSTTSTSSTTNASCTVDSDNITTTTLGIVSDSDENSEYPWKIKKWMKGSDLGSLSRLLVQTNLVKNHILPFFGTDSLEEIESGKGTRVRVRDQDSQSEHELVFKKWTSSNSYVFIGKWYKDFVKRRELKVGDLIGLYWDSCNSRFNFCVIQPKDLLRSMQFRSETGSTTV